MSANLLHDCDMQFILITDINIGTIIKAITFNLVQYCFLFSFTCGSNRIVIKVLYEKITKEVGFAIILYKTHLKI
jgi:hypothetical protein